MNLKINKNKIIKKPEAKKDVLDILKLPKQKNLSKKPLMQIWHEVRYGESKQTTEA